MRRHHAIGILLAALALFASSPLSAQNSFQNSAPGDWQKVLIPDGFTVHDVVNHVTWLADANLPGTVLPGRTPGEFNFRFGLPVCPPLTQTPTEPCVNPTGSMNYTSAVAWIQAMNAANFLGHSNWQLPTAPLTSDKGCSGNGPAPFREGFAFGCKMGALGYLYYTALGFTAPNTAVPIPPNRVGPFRNFQPGIYWSGSGGSDSDSSGGGLTCTIPNFNFGTGAQGGGCGGDYSYVLPVLSGHVSAMIPSGVGTLSIALDGRGVYDPVTNLTWLADANLAARETFGLPRCVTAPETITCVADDGSMNSASAAAWVAAMNAYVDPITKAVGYLGQTTWNLPTLDASCPTYGCGGHANPMGNLYYDQFQIIAGMSIVPYPDVAVGPFRHIVPIPYWACLADTIQSACEPADSSADEPSTDSEWGFSFATGFLGTERVTANHFVTAYYVDEPPPPPKPAIPPKCLPGDANCHQ
jgi:hypothetical protein